MATSIFSVVDGGVGVVVGSALGVVEMKVLVWGSLGRTAFPSLSLRFFGVGDEVVVSVVVSAVVEDVIGASTLGAGAAALSAAVVLVVGAVFVGSDDATTAADGSVVSSGLDWGIDFSMVDNYVGMNCLIFNCMTRRAVNARCRMQDAGCLLKWRF